MLCHRRSLVDLLSFCKRKLTTGIIVLIFLAYKPSVHVVGVGRVEFVKYTLYDGYVRSCSQKEENFAFEVCLMHSHVHASICRREFGVTTHQTLEVPIEKQHVIRFD